ncbi:hypothetical protein SLEP1_g10243 [Rubroshorea leprosula]|uniref:Uncharacterized protein n=1 Tax=Rubroshorea leprosula TaxID=152421 RepID=A0AAV5IIR9_9ROSI|nr:hypothetical protein SLEP1_g10243 [Rubroshorea leprosula]
MVVEKREKIIEYTPMGEELHLLEGGMVAVVRSLALIYEIQERIDVDGGSISLSPIGGRRVTRGDKLNGLVAYIGSAIKGMGKENEEPELDMDMICDGDDVSSDSEQLMKDMDLNSNLNSVTGKESCNQIETGREFERDESYGLAKELGLQRMSPIGPEKRSGLVKSKDHGRTKEMSMEGPRLNAQNPEAASVSQKLEKRTSVSKKQRPLQDCYPESMEEIWAKGTPLETKLERMDVGICNHLCNFDEFDWVVKGSSRASGGLLCIWDRRHFVKREEFTGDGYVGISGEWGVNKQQCCLINVYGPNDKQKRAKLWEELRKMVIDKEGRWLIVGDFKAVRGPEERRGKTRVSSDMRDFEEFIVTTGLVDVKLTNRHYTWYKLDGTTRSRLDRFLLSTEMSNMGGEWIQ